MFTKSTELEQRIRDGEQVSALALAQEYYPELPQELGRSRVYGRINTIRKRLFLDGLTMCQTGPGLFGIPQNKDQVEYGMDLYRRNIERNVAFSMMLHVYSKKQNILPEGMKNKTITLPIFNS